MTVFDGKSATASFRLSIYKIVVLLNKLHCSAKCITRSFCFMQSLTRSKAQETADGKTDFQSQADVSQGSLGCWKCFPMLPGDPKLSSGRSLPCWPLPPGSQCTNMNLKHMQTLHWKSQVDISCRSTALEIFLFPSFNTERYLNMRCKAALQCM